MNRTRIQLGRQPRTLLVLLLLLLLQWAPGVAQAQGARIVEWVENAEATDNSRIALGYPPPIPVDTPVPFDGFRTYSGLHMRHQELEATPFVQGHAVGLTTGGATVWAYVLGDPGHLTPRGATEGATLTNGGIHAREWQTPEVVTGIMELLVEQNDDDFLYSYLRDNVSVILIPVLNVDGFQQTQRFPTTNWLGTDPNFPQTSPRDGRMRRKNMQSVDPVLSSQQDHLLGIDLNRNNAPYWNTSNDSSPLNDSLIYHGSAPASEPETQALDAAAQLGPASELRLYTDVHSFSQVQLWVRNSNDRLANQAEDVMRVFARHHQAFPANRFYGFQNANNVARNRGIGTTDEYFTHTYEVPSWTLEVEPANSSVEYGGLGRNGHDGFILPESQIRRVRTELAQSFAFIFYRQAGPPSITQVHLVDQATGATVFEAEWDAAEDNLRELHQYQPQPLQLGRDYRAWVAFDKPMRWRSAAGNVVTAPGQLTNSLTEMIGFGVDSTVLESEIGDTEWLRERGGAPAGFDRYRDDAVAFDFRVTDSAANANLVGGSAAAQLELSMREMTGLQTDANPATVARWQSGAWSDYEDNTGVDGTDTGGTDKTVQFELTSGGLDSPFLVEAGTSSAWRDPDRVGEGFMLEVLADNRAVMYWFTYDDTGEQDWYIAVGNIVGNRIVFPELLQVSGGIFGPEFDPSLISETVVGSASFTWSACDDGVMRWELDNAPEIRRGRMNLQRLTRVAAIDCGQGLLAPVSGESLFSGSWKDPSHTGEGYTVEVLVDGRALVYWFSFDAEGKRRWFFGVGRIESGALVFDDMLTTRGPKFGADFDPAELQELSWGQLTMDLECNTGTASFSSTEAGFPAGNFQLSRLTSLEGLSCP